MRPFYPYLAAACLLFFADILPAQSTTDSLPQKERGANVDVTDENSEMQVLIESLLQDTEEEDFSFDTQFEYLEAYAARPLDINKASSTQFQEMGLLSELQIQGLMNYRRQYGQIYSFYELLHIPAWDRTTVIKILPYLSLAPQKEAEPFSFKRAFKYSRNSLFLRWGRVIEEQKGFIPLEEGETGTRFLGSPDRLYLRYKLSYKDRMSIGATMEKDAGEEFFKGTNKTGFDFYSAHFFLRQPIKHVTAVAVGDFQAFFGQGLTMWSGFGTRKGPAVLNIKRFNTTLRPYSSANEALFFRGAGASFEWGKRNQWESTVFASLRYRDANISAADTLNEGIDGEDLEGISLSVEEVSNLQITGMHRTTSEMSDKNALRVFSAGFALKYKGKSWHIGSNSTFSQLSAPLQRGGALYQQYLFQGTTLFNTSLDYSYHYKTLQLFGETAISQNGGIASINGLILPLDSRMSLSVLYRYYGRNYWHLYGNAFGERIGVNNENGLYMGLEVSPLAGLKLSAYADLYKFPWMTSLTGFPTQGVEGFIKADYSISRRWNCHLQLRSETRGRNLSGWEGYTAQIEPHTRQSLRFHLACNVSKEWDLRTRLEFSRFLLGETKENGVMLYQDIIYRPNFAPLRIQMRLAVFQTDDFDTRIYAYENDVLYSFSVPAYYGRGMRWYLNTSYEISPNFTLWARIAQTYFADRTVISSGFNEIQGRTRTEVRLQIRYEF